jgi:hypothetical protein
VLITTNNYIIKQNSTFHTWVVAQKMGKILSQGYSLLSNAIVVVITMYSMMHNTNSSAST